MANYQQNFRVEFPSGELKTLEQIIALIKSQHRPKLILGKTKLQEPIDRLEVYLEPLLIEITGSPSGYILEAQLYPLFGQRLYVNQKHFKGFEVSKLEGDLGSLSCAPSPSSRYYGPKIEVRTNPQENVDGIDLFVFLKYEAGKPNRSLAEYKIMEVVTHFSKLLEATVNSVYSCAGLTPQSQKIELNIPPV